MTNLLETLQSRGLLQDATPGLTERLQTGPITGYCGFDPTADSLHVGNLVPVMALAWLQRTGGRPLIVVGGGTGMVGDPGGKRTERPVLSLEEVDANAASIQTQLERFLEFDGPRAAKTLNNASWLRSLGLLEFLRETGKHFTVNYMLQKDSVRSRMETGISFTEFSYMLVQAYDFDHLFETEGCELQLGGSDQWGNITAGVELIARKRQASAHALTLPLLTTGSGAKFGKSEGENIWLDPARTSPYQFYQFWINQEDADLPRLLRMFTFLEEDRIVPALREQEANPSARSGQRLLAGDVTARVHGAEIRERVEAASRILFGGSPIREADAGTLAIVAEEVPQATASHDDLGSMTAVEGLVRVGLASSKAEARRGIEGGGYSLNGDKLTEDRTLTASDILHGRYILLQRGRRHYAVLLIG